MRAEIVHKTRISYHVAEEESTYSKAEIYILSKGNIPDLPLKGLEVTEEEGSDCEGRADDVTDGEKGSEMEYLNYSTPYFLTIYRNFS